MNNTKYGMYIKENRMKLNLSEGDLAQKLGVTTSAISRWENGVSEIKLKHIVSLSYIFGVSLNDFINRIYGENFELDKKYRISKYKDLILTGNAVDIDYDDFANEYLIAYKKLEEILNEFYKNPTAINNELDYLLKILSISFSYDEIYERDDSEIPELLNCFIKVNEKNIKYISTFEDSPTCLKIKELLEKQKNNEIFNLQIKVGIDIENLLKNISDNNIKYYYLMHFDLSEKILNYAMSVKDYNLAIALIIKWVKSSSDTNIDRIKKTLIKYVINSK